ncbi:MAG: 4Fe-4S binding protein [Defluviitaleaceae bacterium]|nr:4Fe-4S binding protein [Defluviitaleaceae bacterium]MCL2274643.1 4Fe-4S binding protein [Defluviitaleaceae bacterium]
MGKKRLLIQIGFFIAQNPFLHNFINGRIFQGRSKYFCTPGLHCHACPAAAFSCPMGALQSFFAGARYSISLYVTGFLLAIGILFGRFICGFVCPFGLVQDLLYRLKTPKIIVRLRFLRYVKYGVLALFVVILPLVIRHGVSGLGQMWFCAYICPSGTLFGALPILAAHSFLRPLIGLQFFIKLAILLGILILSVFILRIFCRVLCPLGAIYSLFNRISVLHMHCDKEKCTTCGGCAASCHIQLEPAKQPNAAECFRCGKCASSCAQKALKLRNLYVK